MTPNDTEERILEENEVKETIVDAGTQDNALQNGSATDLDNSILENLEDQMPENTQLAQIEEEARALKLEAEAAATAALNAKANVLAMRLKAEEDARKRAEAEAKIARQKAEAEAEALRIKAEKAERIRLEKEAEATRLKDEEEARIRAQEEAERLQVEAQAEALRLKAEEADRARLEAEAFALKLKNEDNEARARILAEAKAKEIASANNKVEQMFDSFVSLNDAQAKQIKGGVVIDDESRRYRSTLVTKSTTAAWWTSPESLEPRDQTTEDEKAQIRKKEWLYKQLEQAESALDSTLIKKKGEVKPRGLEPIESVWWNSRGKGKKKPIAVNSARTRRWYFNVYDQENDIDMRSLDISNQEETSIPERQQRKISSISGRNWLVHTEESEEEEEKVVAEDEKRTDGKSKMDDQKVTQSVDADAMSVSSTGVQSVESAIDVLKHGIVGTITALDKGGAKSENAVSFKNPAPVIPLRELFKNSDEILKKHTKRRKAVEPNLVEPKPQIKELIEGLKSDTVARRSNACGTLKLMASQKKNVMMLGKTEGLLDALLLVSKQSPEGADSPAIATYRHRALTTIALLCQAKENRREICENRDLLDTLFSIMKNDNGEALLHSCSAIAALAKTEENREILVDQDGLIEELANTLIALKDVSLESKGHGPISPTQSRVSNTQKIASSARLNACAALLHLSKQCVVSVSFLMSDFNIINII